MKLWRILIVVLIMLLVFSAVIVYSSKYEIVEGVSGYRLFGGCDLYCFSYPAQPFDTAVIACPGKDLIWVWPLPVVSPGLRIGGRNTNRTG